MRNSPASDSSAGAATGHPVIGVGTLNISERAKELVLEALNNNRLSYGPFSKRLESDFARLHGCNFGVLSNSGTSALQIALQALKEMHGWQDGDEVIVPACTFVATANIVLHNRMKPVLVDVDPLYYELNPALLEAAITPRTRAVIPGQLFGQPADMNPIREICQKHGLSIIEDSAETMFASYHGQSVGSLGDIGCFSTYAAHLLVTGVGGLNTTNNQDLAIRLRSLLNHGRDSIYISIDDDKGKSGEELKMIVARRFKFISVGHSFRVTELEAALGLAQLEGWEAMISARRANAGFFTRQLGHLSDQIQLPAIRPGCEHSFMMYPIVLRHESKVEMVNFLETHGVETRDMLPLTNQPVYHSLLGWREADYPTAQWINQNGFYIGCHQDMAQAELDHACEVIEQYLRRQPAQARAGACLILKATTEAAALTDALDEIPVSMFARKIIVAEGTDESLLNRAKSSGFEIVSAQNADSLAMVTSNTLKIDEENLVFFEADGRHDPRDVGRLLLTLERGNDMVVASRFIAGGSRHDRFTRTHYRSIGHRVYTLLANLLFYGNASDSMSTLRAIKTRRLKTAALTKTDLSGAYQLTIRSLTQGWKVTEIPTTEKIAPRPSDWGKIVMSLCPLFGVLLREWWQSRQRPDSTATKPHK